MIATLLALFAKSALVAGFALVMTAALRRRTAAERADILRAAVVVLLLLPPVALFGPDLALRVLDPAPALQAMPHEAVRAVVPLPRTTLSAEIDLPPPWMWAIAAWAMGAALILGRFGLGLLTLARWSRNGRPVDQIDWVGALRRLAPTRRPRLRVTPAVAAPLSWGLSPGRILIGPAQLERPDQAEAVLAHELAHIRRADWLFLALSRVAVALFWFNPLVWIAARELERLSELAVDEAVVRHVDRETYARTLVGLAAQITRNAPHCAAVGMTGPARSLTERIKTVMSDRKPASSRPWLIAGTVTALIAVATPIAALELTARADDRVSPSQVAMASIAAVADVAVQAVARDTDRQISRTVITNDGQTTRYVIDEDGSYVVEADGTRRPLTAEERREVVEARTEAREAAAHARQAATEARAHARVQAHEAELHARQAATEARADVRDQVARAHAMAADAHARGEFARAEAMAHAGSAGHAESVDHAVIREQVARARAAAQDATRNAARHRIDGERIRGQVAREMAAARVEMARGAEGMERGAVRMREEAQRLRDPAYRAKKIEEQRRRGEVVTDQELIDAIPRMLEGADKMEEGAARMREQARSNS